MGLRVWGLGLRVVFGEHEALSSHGIVIFAELKETVLLTLGGFPKLGILFWWPKE